MQLQSAIRFTIGKARRRTPWAVALLLAAKLAARPCTFSLTGGEDGVYTVQVLELPGTISEGDTLGEPLASGRDALTGVIAAMLERGQEIPRAPGDPGFLWDDPTTHASVASRASGSPRPPRQR